MGMLTGEKKTKTEKKAKAEKAAPAPTATKKDTGKVSKLKAWVKNAVNCCIE
jgi:hypothetical protein